MQEDIDRDNDRNSDFNEEIQLEQFLKSMQAEEEAITKAWYL